MLTTRSNTHSAVQLQGMCSLWRQFCWLIQLGVLTTWPPPPQRQRCWNENKCCNLCCHCLVGFMTPANLRHAASWQLQWQNSQGYSGSSLKVHPGFILFWHFRLWGWDVIEKERERESPGFIKCEYSPGWKPVPLPCKHMLFEFSILPGLSPDAPTFSLWQSCHACYFTENTIWYRRSFQLLSIHWKRPRPARKTQSKVEVTGRWKK